MKHVYIAGPFFNEAQRSYMDLIEQVFKREQVPFFSPRAAGGVLTPKATSEERLAVLDSNLDGIMSAGAVLAIVDWKLLPGEQMLLCGRMDPPGAGGVSPKSPPLNLPDSGTVWEMGFAFGINVPVVIMKTEPSGKVNVMLSETAVGVIPDYTGLQDFLRMYKNNDGNVVAFKEELRKWLGETT